MSALSLKIARAETLISNCIFDYGLNKIALSFNGGKDCTVLLDLISRVLRKFGLDKSSTVETIYVTEDEPFPEVRDFIADCEKRYPFIRLKTYPPGLKKAFADFIATTDASDLCILVGVRKTDPYCSKKSVVLCLLSFLGHLQEVNYTDNGWPKFLRIHPILNWSYDDIWEYIDYYQIPYCSLYDRGYTSIGSISRTIPNPKLLKADGSYGYARELHDEAFERSGRLK